MLQKRGKKEFCTLSYFLFMNIILLHFYKINIGELVLEGLGDEAEMCLWALISQQSFLN